MNFRAKLFLFLIIPATLWIRGCSLLTGQGYEEQFDPEP